MASISERKRMIEGMVHERERERERKTEKEIKGEERQGGRERGDRGHR